MGFGCWMGVVSCGLTLVAGAQQGRVARVPVVATGAVTGHVYCVDTNLPARLASVALQPINIPADPVAGARPAMSGGVHWYQTGLDGAFSISKVNAGTYYVVIEMPGYLSPITGFTRAELQQPTPEILTRIMRAVPMVTVESNHTTNAEVRVERGGALAGTIRYDDGSPVAGIPVTPLKREMKDDKVSWVRSQSGAETDDQGHYLITGLSPGEYLPRVSLDVEDRIVDRIVGDSQGSWSSTKYVLSFYAGDTAREDKGKSIKLAAGEQRDGTDITIPVSKLHSVSGTIADASGHVVNAGKLVLSYDDGTQLVSTNVDKEDGMFHFNFVPEGTYTLVVSEAKDVKREEIMNAPGTMPPSGIKETVVKEYGGQKQPLVVESDVAGVVVTVAAKGKP